MPDKKLTDNLSNNSPILPNGLSDGEIKKAFEIFVNSIGKDIVFANVDMKIDGINEYKHIDLTFNIALDLINRLQADVERKDKIYIDLLKTSSERADIISSLQAENERLKRYANHLARGVLQAHLKIEALEENLDELKI